jgi:hypothetical protein
MRISRRFLATGISLTALVAAGCSSQGPASEALPPDAKNPSAKSAVPAPPAGGGFFSRVQPVTLPEGAIVKVRTTNTLSTKVNHAGEPFAASLEEPLIVNNRVIAQKGANVQGLIADADPGGRVKGVARIAVRLTSIETAAGQAEISTNTVAHQAHATKRKDAAKIGIGSGVGAVIGALAGGGKGAAIGAGVGAGAGTGVVLATHGDAAVLPSESVLQFRLMAPLTVNMK